MTIRSLAAGFALVLATSCGLGADTHLPTNPGDDDDDSTGMQVSAVASLTSGVAPLEVEFTGVAAGGIEPLTYRWEFGDGGTEATPTAFHIYQSPGNFVSTFTVTDATGDFASATISLVIGSNDQPVVAATSDVSSGIAPLTVNFQGTVSGGDAPVALEWQFGDGSSSADLEPSYTYQFAGTYNVTFTATDANGDSDSANVLIAVGTDSKPVAAVGADPTSGPAPLNVQFTANAAGGNPALTYAWDFGDGNTSTMKDPMHTYTADGTYNATLVVTDADGDTANSSAAIVVQSSNMNDPDLRLISFEYLLAGAADVYEPNDGLADSYYLGSFGQTYVVNDAFIDPYDAVFHGVVANVGPAVADPFAVDIYQNRATAPGPQEFGDAYDVVLSIGENGTKDVFFTWLNPTPGGYTAWAQVDTDELIAEYAEDNNVAGGLAVDVSADDDFFEVYQTVGFGVTVDLTNLVSDYDVALYDDTGAVVDFSNNGGTTDEQIVVNVPATGYYYVRVYGFDGAASGQTPYSLSVAVE